MDEKTVIAVIQPGDEVAVGRYTMSNMSGTDVTVYSSNFDDVSHMTDPSALSDTDLLAEFHQVEWIAGEPVHEALLEQVRARELDF